MRLYQIIISFSILLLSILPSEAQDSISGRVSDADNVGVMDVVITRLSLPDSISIGVGITDVEGRYTVVSDTTVASSVIITEKRGYLSQSRLIEVGMDSDSVNFILEKIPESLTYTETFVFHYNSLYSLITAI